jgi:hypothetical protein
VLSKHLNILSLVLNLFWTSGQLLLLLLLFLVVVVVVVPHIAKYIEDCFPALFISLYEFREKGKKKK